MEIYISLYKGSIQEYSGVNMVLWELIAKNTVSM